MAAGPRAPLQGEIREPTECKLSEAGVSRKVEDADQVVSITLAEAYQLIGYGSFQVKLFIICGLAFTSDAISIGVISLLQREVSREWSHVGEVELVCLGACVFLGQILGCFIWGPLADRLGRRRSFLLSNAALLLLSCISAVSTNFLMLLAFRALVGIAIGGIVIPFDNLAESTEDKHSATLCFAKQFWWTCGSVFVNGLAALVIEPWGWRIFLALSATPTLLACLGYFVLEESPVWLVDVGREAEALEVLRRAAASNRTDLGSLRLLPYQREHDPSISALFTPFFRRRTLSLSAMWALTMFGYYGAALANPYLFPTKGGHVDYSEFLFSSFAEVVGVLSALLLHLRFGSVTSLAVCTAVASLGCLGLLSIPLSHGSVSKIIVMALAFLMRIGGMGGCCGIWVLSPFAYPTYVRSTAHSLLFGAGRIGGLLATLWPTNAPLLAMMGSYATANVACAALAATEGPTLTGAGIVEFR